MDNEIPLKAAMQRYSLLAKNSCAYLENHLENPAPYFLETITDVSALREKILFSDSRREMELLVNSFLSLKDLGKVDFVGDDPGPVDMDTLLPAKKSVGNFEFISYHDTFDEIGDEISYLLFSVIQIIEKYNLHGAHLEELMSVPSLLAASFSEISLPIALFSAEGELLLYNSQFTLLNYLPHKCFLLHPQEKLEIDGKNYIVYREQFKQGNAILSYFVFVLADIKNELIPKELGIVSSSLAHELNNPLGGILAYIDLLQLEEGTNKEFYYSLMEMKSCAVRCKQLVETFLGLSRITPDCALVGSNASTSNDSIRDAFVQAMDLTRFRMIESLIRLDFDIVGDSSKFMAINRSIFAMVFYLIFGELITAFSHFALVCREKTDRERYIKGKLLIEPNNLKLRIDTVMEFNNCLKESKLINHLIALEHFSMKIVGKEIVFYR